MTFVALTVAAAVVVVGAAFVLGMVLERSRSSDNAAASYKLTTVASDTKPAPRARRHPKTDRREPASPRRPQRTSSSPSPLAVLPPEQQLTLSLLAARERFLDATAVTRYQKALKNEVRDGFCKWDRKRYRCTIVEQLPAPDPQEYVAACKRAARNRAQRRECDRQPPPSGTGSSVEFEVTVNRDRCSSAVIADNHDPTGSGKLEGCLSDA
jgi:hypothetical protein